jgi:ubiquinol-cytochrome c reductase cytochrome b subunit
MMDALRRAGDWLDERTSWRAWRLDHPLVGGSAWGSAIAASVATCFGVLALTGLILMTAYAPAPQSAWASVHYVQYLMAGGWIIRGLHFWAAQLLFVLAVVHVVHGALAATYRKPGEIGWWLTLLVLGLAVAEGITGGLLPWDQLGWWARVVEGNIAGLAPVVGGFVSQMIAGGPELGALGLTRAFTAHVMLLPPAIALALWGRRRLARTPASNADAAQAPAIARRVARNVCVAVLVVFAIFALVGRAHGAPLEAPADPLGDYPARPEWFLLPMFQLRKLFPGVLEFWGTSLVPAAAAGYLALLPFIDRPRRSRGLFVVAPVIAIFAGAIALSFVARAHDAHDSHYQKARAEADMQAAAAVRLAMAGVPPAGALAMVHDDPELHGRELFAKHCASCHVLGDLGDPEKATATNLDGWGTPPWIAAMIRDPDAPKFFGRGPYVGQMPSVDTRPKDKPAGEPWSPMVKSDAEKNAVVLFLAAQGNEPGDPEAPAAAPSKQDLALGEKIVSDRCTGCHLYKGQGDDEGSDVAPELHGYGSLAWTKAQVANPATAQTYRDKALDEAMKKHMPRFDNDLSPADVETVAKWTRSHARAAAFAAR